MKALCAALAATLVLALASCGGSGDAPTSAEANPEQKAAARPASDAQKPRYPAPHLPPKREPLETLIVKNVKEGDGPVARWGDEAVVRYVGLNYDTGEPYSEHWTSSWNFKLDGEQIGPGWQKGIQGMRVGGRREIFIPARLIFEGADGDIAYVVELLKVKAGAGEGRPSDTPLYEQEGPFAAITVRKGTTEPRIDPADRPAPKKLLTRDLEIGLGPPARSGDEVTLYYSGARYETGKVEYGGWARSIELGTGLYGDAWEEGIEGMTAGSRREVIIPSRRLGGSGAVDYLIELIRVKPAAPAP